MFSLKHRYAGAGTGWSKWSASQAQKLGVVKGFFSSNSRSAWRWFAISRPKDEMMNLTVTSLGLVELWIFEKGPRWKTWKNGGSFQAAQGHQGFLWRPFWVRPKTCCGSVRCVGPWGWAGGPLWNQRANFISSNGEICRSLVEILSFSEYDPQDESPRLIGVIIY
jgi:hypothetical protein